MCGAAYRPAEAKVLAETVENFLLHIRCGNCECAIISAVAITAMGVSSAGISTDLSFDEVNRFADAESVSTDDVIAAHDWLKSLTLA